MSNKKRLLIIGLDGASWDIIEPMRKKGCLPAFNFLMENGVWNNLYSTTPPSTFPAWTTFMTGRNPGKHGVFNFTEIIRGTYNIRFLNSTFRRVKSVWRILSESGFRVGVMGVPVTYPPEDINGFMISGFDSPVAKNIDHSFIKPAGLYDEIKNTVGDYRISDLLENFMDESWYCSAREKILHSLDMKARTALHLYRKEPWDCFMVMFGESDTASHHFWKFYDALSPRHEENEDALSDFIPDVYRKIDNIIKSFIENLWNNTSILIVSDHGSGGVSDKAVSINKWLEQKGFIRLSNQTSLLENSFGIFKKMGLKYLPHSFQEKVFRSRFRGFAERMESSSRFKGIVWDRTAAFSEDLGYCPSIHINLKGREPEGTVTGIAEYNRIRDKIIDKILKWKNPETGNSIVRHALKREDVYKGDYVHLAPDIILDFNTDRGYSYLCLPHGSFSSDDAFKRLSKDELTGARLLSMSGSHRPEGIFLLSGRDVSLSGRLPFKTSIQDIYPAILSFFGITPDKEIDGRKIDIFNDLKEDSIDTCQGEEKEKKCIPYTDDQEKKLAELLKNLGYLE